MLRRPLTDNTLIFLMESPSSINIIEQALTGASVAALTIYDMVKAISHNIRIEQTVLVGKSGGKRRVGK